MIQNAIRFFLSLDKICADLKITVFKQRIIWNSQRALVNDDIKAAVRVFPVRENTELCRIINGILKIGKEQTSAYLSEKLIEELQM